MARKKGFKIPGVSFSMKRALGISQAQAKLSRKIGVPLSKSGRQRKLGAATGCAVMLVPFFIALFAGGFLLNSAFAKDTPQVISNINNNEATNEVSGKKSNIPEVSKSATEIKVQINSEELSQKIADAIKKNEDKKPWWNSTVIGAIISSIAVIATSVISYFFQKHNLKKQIDADLKKAELQIKAADKHFERTTDIEIKKITEEGQRQKRQLKAEVLTKEYIKWLQELKDNYTKYVSSYSSYITKHVNFEIKYKEIVNNRDEKKSAILNKEMTEILEKLDCIERERIKYSRALIVTLNNRNDQAELVTLIRYAEKILTQYQNKNTGILNIPDEIINDIDQKSIELMHSIGEKVWTKIEEFDDIILIAD